MKRQLAGYEKAGRLLCLLGWLLLLASICFALSCGLVFFGKAGPQAAPPIALLLMSSGSCVMYLVFGTAIKRHKGWGRTGGFVLGAVLSVSNPIGTILGVYVIWQLAKHWDDPTSPEDGSAVGNQIQAEDGAEISPEHQGVAQLR